jgi:hypothetical protein
LAGCCWLVADKPNKQGVIFVWPFIITYYD